MSFVFGVEVRINADFVDPFGGVADPTTVVIKVIPPTGSVLTPTVIKDSTGHYHGLVTLNLEGVWRWRVSSTGKVAAREGQFTVGKDYFT